MKAFRAIVLAVAVSVVVALGGAVVAEVGSHGAPVVHQVALESTWG
jgi:hypothetical protein